MRQPTKNALTTGPLFPRSRMRTPQGMGVSFLGFSKGVDIYGYLDPVFGHGGIMPTVSVPGVVNIPIWYLTGSSPIPPSVIPLGLIPYPPTSATTLANPLNLQVDAADAWYSFYGTFSWQAVVNFPNQIPSAPILDGSIQVNPLTGSSCGALVDMFSTGSFLIPATSGANSAPLYVSYGFYDAGMGAAGLPSQDQFYLYIVQSRQTWMTDAAAPLTNVPLSEMCLPGAHDAGMCTAASIYNMMDSVEGSAFEALIGSLVTALTLPFSGTGDVSLGALAASYIIPAMINLSITQKDSITAMLNCGIRYFDFRPGYMYALLPALGGALYHQHKLIPGYGYVNFLVDVLTFCSQNPGEVVIINLNDSGFMDTATMSPYDAELDAAWLAACQQADVFNIAPVGGVAALGATYNELISGQLNQPADQRGIITSNQVVFLYQMSNASGGTMTNCPSGVPNNFIASKWDSYSDPVYATTDPTTIAANFQQMSTQTPLDGSNYTVLQCQGTPTNLNGVIAQCVLTSSPSGSPLLGIKPAFDNCNLGWICNNPTSFANNQQMLVILNDFADVATTMTALAVNSNIIPDFPNSASASRTCLSGSVSRSGNLCAASGTE